MTQKLIIVTGIVFPFVTVLIINSCDDDATIVGHKSYNFSGLVIDSVTTLGIDSVTISIEDTLGRLKFYTDSTGLYLASSHAGSTKIFVQKTGYETQFRNILLDRRLDSINFNLVSDTM